MVKVVPFLQFMKNFLIACLCWVPRLLPLLPLEAVWEAKHFSAAYRDFATAIAATRLSENSAIKFGISCQQ